MSIETIEKYSCRYAVLKEIFKIWHSKIFYRRIIVLGKENIDPLAHLIFAPNHQNALMDALAVLFTLKGQPVFLARADIFKKKFIASLLYFLKILPVYRIRDGYNTLKDNEIIFKKSVDVIRNKNGLVILPEGNHEGKRRLRELKKGICRIAFQAEEESGFNLNIKIIPVGIEFSNYYRIRQVLTVIYGKPIEVSEYYDLYHKSPVEAINELKNRLASELKRLIVHIDSIEDYDAIDELRNIINGRYIDDIRYPKLFRDMQLIEKLNHINKVNPDLYRRICSLSLKIKETASLLKIDYRLLEKKRPSMASIITRIFLLFAGLPLFVYGVAFNFIFYLVPGIVLKKIKDKQFYSSIIYTVSLFLALLFLPVYLISGLILISPWWLSIIVFLTIPLAGIMAWNYRIFFNRIKGFLRMRKYEREKNIKYFQLIKDYEELISAIEVSEAVFQGKLFTGPHNPHKVASPYFLNILF